MTTTPELIDQLSGDLSATPKGVVARRVVRGVVIGAAIAAAVVLTLWGLRPDMANAIASFAFWVKLAYPAVLVALGLAAALRLARPDVRVARNTWIGMGLVLAVMAGLASAELWHVPPDTYGRVIMGSTAATCPWLIALLAVPVMAITLGVLRRMAPTRLTLAGAAAGLTAGATAAFVYAWSCGETALPFVLIWYGIGIAIPAVAGALLGRVALRW